MKRFVIEALSIWHDIKLAYRNRYTRHRLGS
jgi:hypothetical protein